MVKMNKKTKNKKQRPLDPQLSMHKKQIEKATKH